jgi:hypothetical protein
MCRCSKAQPRIRKHQQHSVGRCPVVGLLLKQYVDSLKALSLSAINVNLWMQEPKLDNARRIVAEWPALDEEARAFTAQV